MVFNLDLQSLELLLLLVLPILMHFCYTRGSAHTRDVRQESRPRDPTREPLITGHGINFNFTTRLQTFQTLIQLSVDIIKVYSHQRCGRPSILLFSVPLFYLGKNSTRRSLDFRCCSLFSFPDTSSCFILWVFLSQHTSISRANIILVFFFTQLLLGIKILRQIFGYFFNGKLWFDDVQDDNGEE